MKTVCEKNQCAGCMACSDICSQTAITMDDSLYAYNAVIDEKKCINCGACNKICQAINHPILRKPMLWKQGWAQDQEIRKRASSGGIATAIELDFIRSGGIVYTCTFINGDFRFKRIEKYEDVSKCTGSKYVKSNPQGVYKAIRNDIRNYKKVLFVGLPCQVGAIKNYCDEVENLYTIDLICHGTPSPMLLNMFLEEKGRKLKELESISFRKKDRFNLEVDGVLLAPMRITDYYTMNFLKSVGYTENCYSCHYAQLMRVADITLGDSWGSQLSLEEQKKGISLILVQTQKGKELLENSKLAMFDVDLEKAVENNHQLRVPSTKPKERELFLSELLATDSFMKATLRAFPKQYAKDSIKKILLLAGIIKDK